VVDKVSFRAEGGQILGFLGPNGAGKTTTIRMIMGIIAADEGEIKYFTDSGQKNGIPSESIGYLPEERGLYKEARVMNVLQFLAGLKNVPRSTVKERAVVWLKRFDLSDYAHAKVEELSKGMLQKVQFVASVLHQPQIIILDEPFSGLDPVSQDMFKAILRDLAQDGAAILLSSHQMNILEELCDRIYLIHEGKEVFNGTLQEVKEKYGNYRVNLTLSRPDGVEKLLSTPIIREYHKINETRYMISLEDGVVPGEFLSSIDKQLPVQELSLARSSLHDIFVRIALGGVENE
jgi:ABC-2 type transport system ATP-binding protein